MLKKLLIIGLLLIVNFEGHFAEGGTGFRSKGGSNYERAYNSGGQKYYGGGYSGAGQPPIDHPQEPPRTAKEYLDHKSGFSTFGIISIIFVIIVVCLAFYYGILCYPLLCKDDKKYRDISDMSSTITGAHSCSIQSIENYPDDQKH